MNKWGLIVWSGPKLILLGGASIGESEAEAWPTDTFLE